MALKLARLVRFLTIFLVDLLVNCVCREDEQGPSYDN
jgi:hypothetical protein